MATYKQIAEYVKKTFDETIKSCWIAHVKELCGIPVRAAHNRISPDVRQNPCPPEKINLIKEAFRHFDMI
jgi:hypothetical protein